MRFVINYLLGVLGYKISRKINSRHLNTNFINNYNRSKNLSSFNIEFFIFLEEALKYITNENNPIKGDIVECGVFKGANCRFICEYLKLINKEDKEIYLYDTFQGMPEANDIDTNTYSKKNYNTYLKKTTKDNKLDNFYKYEKLDTVKNTLFSTNYNKKKINFIEGLVQNTIPKIVPNKICLLILDTDYYESTKYELKHLYPLVEKGGIIVIDDYGTWNGVKKAVDEYFLKSNNFRSYIDHKTIYYIKN